MNSDKLMKTLAKYIPMIKPPLYRLSLKEKLKWTGIILFIYIFLSFIPVWGVKPPSQTSYFMTIQYLLGSRFGSLMTLGIGPIVTAGIILQLLVGSKIIDWDTTKQEDRKKFQTWEKILAVFFVFIEATAYVVAGALPTIHGLAPLVILQIAMGGLLVLLMDEIVSKWGLGSGISLFIVAGIATQIIIRLFSPFPIGCSIHSLSACIPSATNPPAGRVWEFLIELYSNNTSNAVLALIPILSTVLVFFLIVYAQSIRVDIPLAFAALRGFGRTWSLNFFYTSNIPVILMTALLANFQMMARTGLHPVGNYMCGPLGCFDQRGTPISGFAYYVSAPYTLIEDAISGSLTMSEVLRAIVYFVIMSLGAVLFSVFWVNTSGMDPKSVAEQISAIGMQIPGYRRDPRIIEKVLAKYINPLAVMGGFAVGALAAIADFTHCVVSGTGILLTVMIIYNYYQLLRQENLEEAPRWLRKILGE